MIPAARILDRRSWLKTHDDLAKRFCAVVTCPDCRKPCGLARHLYSVMQFGTVLPEFKCPHPMCGFHAFIELEFWS